MSTRFNSRAEICSLRSQIYSFSTTPHFWLYLPNAEITLDLEVNEVEVKVLTSLASVTWSTAQGCVPYKRASHRRAPHGRAPHWRAPHGGTPHGRVPHRRVSHGRVPHRHASHRRVPHGRASHGHASHGR